MEYNSIGQIAHFGQKRKEIKTQYCVFADVSRHCFATKSLDRRRQQ
jgi:hypothetical protein